MAVLWEKTDEETRSETANCIYWTTRLPWLSEEYMFPRNNEVCLRSKGT